MSTQQTLAFLGHLPFTVGNCCETKSYQHEPMKYQFEKFYFLCNSLGIQKEYFNLHHLQSSLSTLKDYRSKMYLTRCAIWYYLHNLNPPWVFFTFFKLYKWYQIEEHITYVCINSFFTAFQQLLLTVSAFLDSIFSNHYQQLTVFQLLVILWWFKF